MPIHNITAEQHFFKDDGKIPNSKYPVLIYRGVHTSKGNDAAAWYKDEFENNGWTKSWKEDGIYNFHHYHSTAHEVLGICNGKALIQLGGEHGEQVNVQAGDVIIIPAGTGHKQLKADDDFGVVGAYAEGRDWDVLRGAPGERPAADKRINNLPIPSTDPLTGTEDGLTKLWVN